MNVENPNNKIVDNGDGSSFEIRVDESGVVGGSGRVDVPNSVYPLAGSDIASHAKLKSHYASLDPDYVPADTYQVDIFAFNGNHRLGVMADNPLVSTGHVGFSLDGGKTKFGFGPSQNASGLSFDAIKSRIDFPGAITNDTELFANVAAGRYDFGSRVMGGVSRGRYNVSPGVYERLQGAITNGVGDYRYRLPAKSGFEVSDPRFYNCTQFATFGIPGLDQSGVVPKLIKSM